MSTHPQFSTNFQWLQWFYVVFRVCEIMTKIEPIFNRMADVLLDNRPKTILPKFLLSRKNLVLPKLYFVKKSPKKNPFLLKLTPYFHIVQNV
jgi:hypothetical protein